MNGPITHCLTDAVSAICQSEERSVITGTSGLVRNRASFLFCGWPAGLIGVISARGMIDIGELWGLGQFFFRED